MIYTANTGPDITKRRQLLSTTDMRVLRRITDGQQKWTEWTTEKLSE